MRKPWRSVAVTLLLLVSVAEFSVRGPLRILQARGWNDFLSPYIQAKAWVHGKDPYSTQSLISFWPSDNQRPPFVDREAASGVLEMKRGIPSPYPLSSLVVVSPLSLFPWSVALLAWIAVSVAAVVLSPFALLSICGCSVADLRARLFLAAVFALAPLHTGLGTANPAMLAVSLTVGTVWAERHGKKKTAGILLAIAVCLKPTVAGALLLYYLVRRQWKVAGIACAAAAMIGVLGVARLTLVGVPWFPTYIESTRKMFSAGSIDDFTRADAIRFNMINAQVLFYSLLRNAALADQLARLLGAALLGVWLWLCYRRRRPSELLEISAISVLSLISAYHRFYDAALLIWPLAWGLLLAKKRSIQVVILAVIAPFLVPGPVLITGLALKYGFPPAVTNSWWWNTVVLPHEVWALVLAAVVLLHWMAQESSEKPLPVFSDPGIASVRQDSALSEPSSS
jgi:hypothetical protein